MWQKLSVVMAMVLLLLSRLVPSLWSERGQEAAALGEAVARLDAIPWTRFTVEAQAQLEREGALRQRRLGQLGSVDASGGGVDVEGDDEESGAEDKSAKEKE